MSATRRLVTAILLIVITGCCAPTSARQAAAAVVDELARAVRSREQAYEQLLRRVLIEHFQHVRSDLDAKWALRRSELKVQIADRVLAKREELTAYTRSEMDQAIGARLEQMSKALEEAKADAGKGPGSEDKKTALALQFAATLAFTNKTVFELDEKVAEKLAAVRSETMARVDQDMAVNPVAFDPEAQVEVVLKDLRSRADTDYLLAFDQGATELKRFIQLDSAPALVLKGLFGDAVGDKMFASLQTFANKKLDDLAKQADAKVTAILADQDKKTAESIKSLRK